MYIRIKKLKFVFVILSLIFFTNLNAEEDEIYLKSLSDQIQVLIKDLKTLEKAVYQKSDITLSNSNTLKSDGLNEDILTKHLLKLNEIENPRELCGDLNIIPGVVENGLFIDVCSAVVVGYSDGTAEISWKKDIA